MNVVLVMFRENGDRRSFSLSHDVTVVGRREDADFRIPLTDVSRKHCRLIKDGDFLVVEDLGSANGTYVNGKRVTDAELSPGDTLQIGPVQFLVQIDGVPSEADLPGHHTMAARAVATGVPESSALVRPSLPPAPPASLGDASRAPPPAAPPMPPMPPLTQPVQRRGPDTPTIDETPEEMAEILDAGELEEIVEDGDDAPPSPARPATPLAPPAAGEILEDPTDLVEVNDDIIYDDTAAAENATDDVMIDFGEDEKK